MNMMTAIVPSAKAQVLLLNARDEWSRGNAVSEGAVALAEFLAVHGDEQRADGLVMFLGGWKTVGQMLADAMQPGLEWGEELGRVTDGAVTSRLWARQWSGTLSVPAADDEPEESVLQAEVAELNVGSLGALGTVPPGPLFRFASVADAPSLMQIRGLGIAIELSEPALSALRDACMAAIADIRASEIGGAQA